MRTTLFVFRLWKEVALDASDDGHLLGHFLSCNLVSGNKVLETPEASSLLQDMPARRCIDLLWSSCCFPTGSHLCRFVDSAVASVSIKSC